jgi:hypothetical protein
MGWAVATLAGMASIAAKVGPTATSRLLSTPPLPGSALPCWRPPSSPTAAKMDEANKRVEKSAELTARHVKASAALDVTRPTSGRPASGPEHSVARKRKNAAEADHGVGGAAATSVGKSAEVACCVARYRPKGGSLDTVEMR